MYLFKACQGEVCVHSNVGFEGGKERISSLTLVPNKSDGEAEITECGILEL